MFRKLLTEFYPKSKEKLQEKLVKDIKFFIKKTKIFWNVFYFGVY